MKINFILFIGIFLFAVSMEGQSVSGIWCSKDQKEVFDLAEDGRYKVFGKNYVKYGRYNITDGFLWLKEIGNTVAAKIPFAMNDQSAFKITNKDNEVVTYAFFEESKLSQEEYTRALRLYYLRDNIIGLDGLIGKDF